MKNIFFTIFFFYFFSQASGQSSGKPSGQSSGKPAGPVGTQPIKTDTQRLAEMVVRGKKPLFQQATGGIVVNLESSLLTKGSSALEVLERSPGVLIDHRNNGIALNGKSGVMVMLNGKLIQMPEDQLVTLLSGMSADNIEKIELLTTPPARYDAEGSAGMINIVLKKIRRQGTNGNFSLTGGYGWAEKGTGSISLGHNTEKLGVYSAYSFSHDRSYGLLIGHGSENVPVLGGPASFDFRGETRPAANNHNALAGMDAKLTPKITVGASMNYNNSYSTATADNYTKYTLPPDSLLLFDGIIKAKNRWTNWIASLYAEKKIGEGEKIDVDLDWLYYKNNHPSVVQSSFLDKNGAAAGTGKDSLFSPSQKGFANTTIKVGVARMDYEKQLSKKVSLGAGVKGTYTVSSSLSGIESLINGGWVTSLGTTNFIGMKEGIGAAYGSVATQIGASARLVIGARYEYSRTRMKDAGSGKNIIDRKLGALFPDISFSKKLGEKDELQLSYGKRISRPSYNDLASFITYNDPISVFTGNPLLRPSVTNNLKLGYNYRRYSFSLLLSRDDYPIARYQLTANPSGNLVFISPQNVTWQNNITVQAVLPLKINDWWDMSYSLEGGWRRFKITYTQQPVEKTFFPWSLNFSESFTLPRSFFAEISGWYSAAGYYGSTKGPANGSVNMGIKKELEKNRGSLQLSVTDLLMTIHYTSYIGALTEEAYSTRAHVTYSPESARFPIIRLTYSRSFGNNKAKKERTPDAGSKEERDRVRKE
ncbi:MAG TPA: TonB-dependent receptor [Puia sp.]|nr:TonB-dependent receptor [Puia sp.]